MPDTISLPTFIPLAEAARKYNLSEGVLTRLILDGRIHAGRLPSGDIVVSDDKRISEVESKEQVIQERFAHLRGKPVGIAEAARKYGITHPTISRWMRLGYIRRLGTNGQKILVDLADVAYCADVYRQRRGKQGRRIFDSEGYPYQSKSPA